MSKKSLLDNKIYLSLFFLLPIIIYFAVFFKYAVNMPNGDDYFYVNILDNLQTKHSFIEWLKILTKCHNEHRITLVRLFFLAQYLICGELNFIVLNFIGQLGLCLNLALILKIANNYKIRFKYLLPIPYVLFALSQSEYIACAMTSIQQYYQLFFAILSIYIAINCQKKYNLFISFFCSLIATFTGGGGLLCYPVIALYYFVYGHIKKLFMWLGLSTFVFVLYFKILEYHPVALTQKWQKDALHNINGLIEYFFTIVGSFLSTSDYYNTIAKTIIGLFLIIAIANIFYKKYYNKYKDITFIIIYLLVSCMVIAFNRFNIGLLCASRYTIYSLSILCLTYLIYIKESYCNKLFYRLFTIFAFGIFTYWLFASNDEVCYFKFLLDSSFNFKNQSQTYDLIRNSFKNKYISLPQSVKAILPENIPLDNKALYKNGFIGCIDNLYSINSDGKEDSDGYEIMIRGWALCPKPYHKARVVILKINEKYFPTNYGFEAREDICKVFGSSKFKYSGFKFSLDKNSLPPKPWKINLLVVDQNNSAIYQSPTKLIN